jgi:hypothetical protein
LTDVHGQAIQFDNNKAYAALIQRPAEPTDEDKEKDNAKKSALRCAFGTKNIRTQMKRRFPDEGKRGLQNRYANPQQEERSKLTIAASDMLISGTGMSYDAPAKIYTDILGFDEAFAQSIVVEYWVRYKAQKPNPRTDFIAVARQYADTGYIEIIFPDAEGNPLKALSVHDTALHLQRLFAKGQEKDRVYARYDDVPTDAVLNFFQSQLTHRTQPTLIVPQVGDWRSKDTKWFSDDVFQPNVVNIGNRIYSAASLTNVRMVKMLTDDRYNMRYWQPSVGDYKGLIAIRDTFNRIPTLYSIDNGEFYQHEGNDIEDRYSRGQVIEFAATLMQDSDDTVRQLAWCGIPHLARIHSGWSRATIYPYPYHIVKNMIKDALWTVFEK